MVAITDDVGFGAHYGLADEGEAGGGQWVVGRVKEHQTELAHLNIVAVG